MTALNNNSLSLNLWSSLLHLLLRLSSINQTLYLATSRPHSPFGSLAAQTQMQYQSLTRVYRHFRQLLFPHTMHRTQALHSMGSLLSSRISIYRYLTTASCSPELSILSHTDNFSPAARNEHLRPRRSRWE